jgi:predicted transposase/invertase (TIGR01784 family)
MKLIKPGDIILNPCLDCVFKALFVNSKNDFRELKALLSRMLDREVKKVSLINNEPPSTNFDDKQVRFDISCTFDDGELADVEMSLNPTSYERHRMEYYLARLFMMQKIKGDDYSKLKMSYQISILGDNLFKDDKIFHEFEFYDAKNKVKFDSLTRIITAEFAKTISLFDKNPEDMLPKERLLLFFAIAGKPEYVDLVNKLVEIDEVINMLTNTLEELAKSYELQAQAITAQKRQIDWKLDLRSERSDGYRQGRQEGRQEEKFATALAMIKKNLPVDIISFCTGLSNEEIKKLMEENK